MLLLGHRLRNQRDGHRNRSGDGRRHGAGNAPASGPCRARPRVVAPRRRSAVSTASGGRSTYSTTRSRTLRSRCSAFTATHRGRTSGADLLATAPPGVRVIAVDHLDMGFSERTGTAAATRAANRRSVRRSPTRSSLTGPVVTVAHDWGGPISLGWAQRHRRPARRHRARQHGGPSATGARRPDGHPDGPGRWDARQVTVRTSAFVRGALRCRGPTAADRARRVSGAVRYGGPESGHR